MSEPHNTPTEAVRVDNTISNIEDYIGGNIEGVEPVDRMGLTVFLRNELESLITAHTNAEIAKVLDRAKQRFHEPIEHDGSYISISVIDKTFDELIKAERAKSKENA